jgi:chromosome segregation ATPase
MLKKGLLAGAGIVLLLTLFFGRDMFSYVSTSVDQVTDSVKGSVPIQFELERARKMIKDLDPEIIQHKRKIVKEEIELNKLEEKVNGDEAQLAKNWRDIQRLRDDLSRGGSPHFVYKGVNYTSEQVEQDLEGRFERFQKREATLENMQKVLDARRAGLAAAHEKVKAMIDAKRQLEVEVENLEARLQMVEVAKASSDFVIDDSRLSRTRELLSDIEARIEVDAQLVNAQDIVLDEIPLDEPVEATNILDRITDYENAKDPTESFVEIELDD